jgi:hypothetical protein
MTMARSLHGRPDGNTKATVSRLPGTTSCATWRKLTVSPLIMIPLVYCHIKSFQRASNVEKPLEAKRG